MIRLKPPCFSGHRSPRPVTAAASQLQRARGRDAQFGCLSEASHFVYLSEPGSPCRPPLAADYNRGNHADREKHHKPSTALVDKYQEKGLQHRTAIAQVISAVGRQMGELDPFSRSVILTHEIGGII